MKNVEDVLPLSPLQESLLSRALASPGADPGVVQAAVDAVGEVDLGRLEAAWRLVVERHPVLRTAFVSDRLERPVQVVRRAVEVPFAVHDWRRAPGDEVRGRLERLAATERDRGFDPARAPLLRLHGVRLPDGGLHLLWTYHHLILDGWSRSLVFDEVLAAYAALGDGGPVELPGRPPFRDYIAWLRGRDERAAERFWRDLFAGRPEPTPLVVDRLPGPRGRATEAVERRLSADASELLTATARRRGLTVATAVQGAWALLLALYSGREEVTFGIALSGRPPEIPGIESAVGMFVNNLPLRVPVPRQAVAGEWLARVQERFLELRRFEWCSPEQVHRWSGLAWGERLFDSLVLVQNFPLGGAAAGGGENGGGPRLTAYRGHAETAYPLTVTGVPGPATSVRLAAAPGVLPAGVLPAMAERLAGLLGALAERPGARLAELLAVAEEEAEAVLADGTRASLRDARLSPVPAGVPGELCWVESGRAGSGRVESGGVESGRAEPGGGEPGAESAPPPRWRRTGRLARRLPDGSVEPLGPVDPGLPPGAVTAGEVEAALRADPAVRDAAAVEGEDRDGLRHLRAFVVAGGAADLAGLRRRLGARIPARELPRSFALCDELPRAADGDVDRAALAARLADRPLARPPRDHLELRLVQIFQDLFGFRPIGVDDDFFALGGHSLLAVQLVSQMRIHLGRDLPVSFLIGHPTVAALARALGEDAAAGAAWSPLVELSAGSKGSSGSEGRPLFLVHPAGGDVMCYLDLCRRLGGTVGVVGLRARGNEAGQVPHESIEAMAEEYRAAIRSRQPRGPYRVGGWSFGGLVAFEIARRLRAEGEEVELLALFDTDRSRADGERPPAVDHAEALAAFVSTLRASDLEVSAAELRRAGDAAAQEELVFGRAVERGLVDAGFDRRLLRRYVAAYRATLEAARRFSLRPYPGVIDLFRATEGASAAIAVEQPALGWDRVGGAEVRSHEVPGRHRTLVYPPAVDVLAERLREALSR